MLGIIIGIMSVIFIISVGHGAQSLIISQIKSQGSNLIAVFPGNSDDKGPPVSVMGIVITTLKYNDVKKVSEQVPEIVASTAYVRGTETMSANGNKKDASFVGVSYSLPQVEDLGISIGQFFSEDDEKTMQKVVVLGPTVRDDLFGAGADPTGELVKIGKHSFRVVGVTKVRGSSGFSNQDSQVYIPVTTAQKIMLGIDYISFARFKVRSENEIDSSMEEIKQVLRAEHDTKFGEADDFDVRSQKQSLEVLTKITGAITLFLAAIAAIALIVGGIGIMNIMLVAVQERTREIGLRKAVGAKNKQIMSQFLIETMFLTTIAGVFGIIMGILFSYLVAVIARALNYEWEFSVSIMSIFLSVGVSTAIGLVFGLIPARRASNLNPISALSYE